MPCLGFAVFQFRFQGPCGSRTMSNSTWFKDMTYGARVLGFNIQGRISQKGLFGVVLLKAKWERT